MLEPGPAGKGASDAPMVSIVLPCRNEARFISKCLDSLVTASYPGGRLEVLVVDGMSDDGTREIVRRYAERYPFVDLLDNPHRIIPAAMNIGIRHASGDIIMKIDAHSEYFRDYVAQCVRALQEWQADSVGGVLITKAADETLAAQAIAVTLSHPFGSGNSLFRIGTNEPCWTDTVACACFRRDVVSRVGFYDENLVRSSDMDLHTRIRRAGGRVLLDPSIVAYYYPAAHLRTFWRRNFADGFWAIFPIRYGSSVVSWRHVVPLIWVVVLLATSATGTWVPAVRPFAAMLVLMYLVVAIGVSAWTAARAGNLRLAFHLLLAFSARHFGYGLGSLWAGVRVVSAPAWWARSWTRRRVATESPVKP